MKFLTKINRHYLLTLSVLLFLTSTVGYFVLQNILTNNINEDFFEKEYAIINEIKTAGILPNLYPIIETKEISKKDSVAKSFKEVTLRDEADNEEETYVEYTNTVKIDNRFYLITLRHSLLKTNELILAISLPLLFLLIIAFIISFITTHKLNKTVWKDLESNLVKIQNFSFSELQKLELKQTNIEEFDNLNKTVAALTQKLQNDYLSLKEFTENASHEIQTPISIILLNLDELLQQNLSEPAFKQIVATKNAVNRLSKLNKNLLLLAKINNQQFVSDKNVDTDNIIQNKIKEFSPLLKTNNLTVEYQPKDNFVLKIHPELVDILINNLFSNAINHNLNNGKIKIETSSVSLKICNTGNPNSLSNDNIFNRFTKDNSHSYGLGLAIVKQICDTNNIEIIYSKNEFHCFTLSLIK